MGKAGLLLVVLSLFLSARCYNADMVGALGGLPIVGPMVSPPPATPGYVTAMGTPATTTLPDTDPAKWFVTDASTDPYDATKWTAIQAYLANASTQVGWAEVCKKVAGSAGADRSAKAQLGALACSADPSVTRLQTLAVDILRAQAVTALWIKGAPGGSLGAIQGVQGEIRIFCATDITSREGADSPLVQACAKALDTSYVSGDARATFTAFGDAYTLAATEIAKRDPKTAQEPAYFDAPAKK